MPRSTVHYQGHVQGVGFRATAHSIAQRFAVAGYVRNLTDGRVQLVAEGDASEVDAFLAAVQDRLGPYVHHATRDDAPPTNEFTTFTIRY